MLCKSLMMYSAINCHTNTRCCYRCIEVIEGLLEDGYVILFEPFKAILGGYGSL